MYKRTNKLIVLVFFIFLTMFVVLIAQQHIGKVIYLDKGEENIRILGDDYDDRSGVSVTSGDINGDGYDDIIIGAHRADPAGGTNAGETYVIFGSAAPPATVDLNSVSADMTIYGDDAHDHSGYSVSSGDINGDGYADVIIGANSADPAGGTGAGETYVIFGSAAPPATVDLNSVSADMTIYGDDADDHSGISVSSGDINGDGYDDVIIGAYGADPATGRDRAGEIYVIFGSGPPLPIEYDFSDTDISDWEKIGTGRAIVQDGQLLMKRTTRYLRLFPPGAVSDKCNIEVKVNRKGGLYSKVSSSILFGYKDKKNYWELKMFLYQVGAKISGKWILQHKKDGVFVDQRSVVDTINRGQQYSINVEVRENLITIYIDGEKKIEQTVFEKPVLGKIALEYRGSGTSRFDDLKIY